MERGKQTGKIAMKQNLRALIVLAVGAIAAAVAGYATKAHTKPADFSSAPELAHSLGDQAASVHRDGTNPGASVRIRLKEYSASISNAGMPGAYTAFMTVTRTFVVQSSSAATVDTNVDGPMTFPTLTDQQHWRAEGSPTLTPDNGRSALSAGQFSFIRQGVLTYEQAMALPATPAGLTTQILGRLRSHAPTVMLRQLGYLIATAPLSTSARSAAWHAVASITGLRLCGSGTDLAGRRGEGLCADSQGEEVEVLIDSNTGSVLAVEERLLQPSLLYPNVSAGSLIGSTTFLAP